MTGTAVIVLTQHVAELTKITTDLHRRLDAALAPATRADDVNY